MATPALISSLKTYIENNPAASYSAAVMANLDLFVALNHSNDAFKQIIDDVRSGKYNNDPSSQEPSAPQFQSFTPPSLGSSSGSINNFQFPAQFQPPPQQQQQASQSFMFQPQQQYQQFQQNAAFNNSQAVAQHQGFQPQHQPQQSPASVYSSFQQDHPFQPIQQQYQAPAANVYPQVPKSTLSREKILENLFEARKKQDYAKLTSNKFEAPSHEEVLRKENLSESQYKVYINLVKTPTFEALYLMHLGVDLESITCHLSEKYKLSSKECNELFKEIDEVYKEYFLKYSLQMSLHQVYKKRAKQEEKKSGQQHEKSSSSSAKVIKKYDLAKAQGNEKKMVGQTVTLNLKKVNNYDNYFLVCDGKLDEKVKDHFVLHVDALNVIKKKCASKLPATIYLQVNSVQRMPGGSRYNWNGYFVLLNGEVIIPK